MRYPMRIEEDGDQFTAYIPGFGGPTVETSSGIVTCGRTLAGARHNAQEALEGVILTTMDEGRLPHVPPADLEQGQEWVYTRPLSQSPSNFGVHARLWA